MYSHVKFDSNVPDGAAGLEPLLEIPGLFAANARRPSDSFFTQGFPKTTQFSGAL